MKAIPLPSQQRLKEVINYDPNTGIATWKARIGDAHVARWNGRMAGKVAGGKAGRYMWISIDDHNYLLHRVIYKWMTGLEPLLIDHKDGDKLNNKWDNLRNVTSSQNRCNSPVTSRSISGVKGVRQCEKGPSKGKWQGTITVARKPHRTAMFDTLEEAKEATEKLRASLHGSFARN